MASLLERLETGLHRSSGAGERLRNQVDRIDGYMRTSLLLDIPGLNDPMPAVNTNPETAIPSAYTWSPPAARTTPGAGLDQMSQFQLPPELLTDWPWPLNSYNTEGFLPLAFE